ncbi:hypothetical protein QQ045_028794 [Rhodiola kirilowii]
MDAVDEYIPDPVCQPYKPFLMPIEDVFSIQGRGTVATGRIEQGTIKVGEEVEISGLIQIQTYEIASKNIKLVTRAGPSIKSVVTGVEMFKKILDRGEAGDNVGLLLRGLKREDIERRMPRSEGGRHTAFFSNYMPQFYLRTANITGKIELPESVKMVMPGDNITATFELMLPAPLEAGQRFALREGGRTVGAGVVSKAFRFASFSSSPYRNGSTQPETDCPVPFDQQPINEYNNLSTNWASVDLLEYCSRLFVTGAAFALFVGVPVAWFGAVGPDSEPVERILPAASSGVGLCWEPIGQRNCGM